MPSTITGKLYKNIQAKYFEYASLSNKNKKTEEIPKDQMEKESWSRGNKRKRTNESHYYNNHDFLKMGKKTKEYDFGSIDCSLFDRTYDRYFSNGNQIAKQ